MEAVATPPVAPGATQTLPGPTDLGIFWEPWFASPYEYMFTSPAGLGWEESPGAAAQGRVQAVETHDVLVVGSRVAGLTVALETEIRYQDGRSAQMSVSIPIVGL